MTVVLRHPLPREEAPRIGDRIRAEAGEYHGHHLTVFNGAVVSVDAGLIRIKFDGTVDQVQRREYPRAAVSYLFATAKLMEAERKRFFMVQPVDLSGGGVRFRHRVPLTVGDHFELTLRLSRSVTLTPVAEIVEVWNQSERRPGQHPMGKQQDPRYVARARFTDISDHDRDLIRRYVAALIRRGQQAAIMSDVGH